MRLVFTLISLCSFPLRPKQILIICIYDGFLVITGSMLKFVTKGDMEPSPSTSQGPSSSTTSTDAASPSASQGPSSIISLATDAAITPSAQPVDPARWPAHLSDVDHVEFCTNGLLRLCQISLSLRQMKEVFLAVCPTGHLQMEIR